MIIYATGNVGSQFVQKVRETDYCKLVCALDKKWQGKEDYPIPVFPPEKVKELSDHEYDTILIAISEYNLSCIIEKNLIELGVPQEKIVKNYGGTIVKFDGFDDSRLTEYDDGSSVLRMAVVCYGGIGDFLVTSQLLHSFKRVMPDNLMLDFWVSSVKLYEDMPFIDDVYNSADYHKDNGYDVVMSGGNFFEIAKINLIKVKRFSESLYDYFQDMIWHFNRVFPIAESSASNRLLQYCRLFGKNRVEQQNVHNILPLDRESPTYLGIKTDALQIVDNLGLFNKRYITVCTTVNIGYIKSPKLYPLEYFNEIVSMIKSKFPDIHVVRVGESDSDGELNYVDINLCDRTSLFELNVILKYSTLHIGCEGGLIHLKHFLNGKSCCIFGGTVPEIYGYDENINLRSGIPENCSYGCEHINYMWTNNGCLLDQNAKYPLCTQSLNPIVVFDAVYAYLSTLTRCKYIIQFVDSFDELFENNFNITLVNRENDSFVLNNRNKVKSITIYDKDLSEKSSSGVVNSLYERRLQSQGVTAEYGNIYNIPAKDCTFDLVLNFTLEKEAEIKFALLELLRITKPQGRIVIPNRGSIVNSLDVLDIRYKRDENKFMIIRKVVL